LKTTLDSAQFEVVNGVLTKLNKLDEFTDRLYSRRIIDENGCWNYTGFKLATGHGQISYKGLCTTVSRAAYMHFIGDIGYGQAVAHTCNNNACFNPEHLYINELIEGIRGKSKV